MAVSVEEYLSSKGYEKEDPSVIDDFAESAVEILSGDTQLHTSCSPVRLFFAKHASIPQQLTNLWTSPKILS